MSSWWQSIKPSTGPPMKPTLPLLIPSPKQGIFLFPPIPFPPMVALSGSRLPSGTQDPHSSVAHLSRTQALFHQCQHMPDSRPSLSYLPCFGVLFTVPPSLHSPCSRSIYFLSKKTCCPAPTTTNPVVLSAVTRYALKRLARQMGSGS